MFNILELELELVIKFSLVYMSTSPENLSPPESSRVLIFRVKLAIIQLNDTPNSVTS